MPNSRAEEEPPREEPGDATPPESADEQGKTLRRATAGKTFLEHGEDSMNEHDTLLRLLTESERQCRESRTQGLPGDLPGRRDRDDQPGRRSCRGT